MSQLATVPRLQTAKALQKAKHIRKVKAAIKWHERARKQRQALMQERWESKQAVLSHNKWIKENITDVRKDALKNAKEDWMLGPLRPNRAIGDDAERYGAIGVQGMRMPEIPVRVQKNRNEVREKKGAKVEYPLVVDDVKYFPIVKDDRVVVIKGREKHKIGVVQDVIEESHEVIIKDINMHYADSRAWNTPPGETVPPKREVEIAIPFSDVRLVTPYAVQVYPKDSSITSNPQTVYQDVIVDEIAMERHSTGIDPFTLVDHGNAPIPEKHRYDPQSGLPIFHRYIAGTRERIEWPWEKEEEIENTGKDDAEYADQDAMSKVRNGLSKLRHPIQSYKRWKTKREQGAKNIEEVQNSSEHDVLEVEQPKDTEEVSLEPPKPRYPDLPPDAEGTDTTRNIVETGEDFVYRVAYPEYPPNVVDELRPHLRQYARELRKTAKDDSSLSQVLSEGKLKTAKETEKLERVVEELTQKSRLNESMKTPMQLRWEQEQIKKGLAQSESPKVSTDALLLALGQHMQKNGVSLTDKRKKAAHKWNKGARLLEID